MQNSKKKKKNYLPFYYDFLRRVDLACHQLYEIIAFALKKSFSYTHHSTFYDAKVE